MIEALLRLILSTALLHTGPSRHSRATPPIYWLLVLHHNYRWNADRHRLLSGRVAIILTDQ